MIDIEYFKKRFGCELAAIILCCRVFFETATANELKIFIETNDIDWDNLIRLTSKHRIRPIVFKILHLVNLPPAIKDIIHKQHTELTKLSLKQAFETERIIILLQSNGIEAVPYKGAAFSKQFYGDLVSRESSDIDLIINPDYLPGAIKILLEDAYLPENDEVYKYLKQKYFLYFKDYNFNKFTNGSRDFHVELHWGIATSDLNLDTTINHFLYNSRIDGSPFIKNVIKILDPQSHFSAIVIHHSMQDTFRHLKNILDISQAIKSANIQKNCDSLTINFKKYNISKLLEVSNSLSGQLMGVYLFQLSNSDNNVWLGKYFIDKVCFSERSLPRSNLVGWIKTRALLQDSFSRKMRFYFISALHRFIPAETDFNLIKLPSRLFILYYIIKPFRSLIKRVDDAARKQKLIPPN